MSTSQTSRYCRTCGQQTLHARELFSGGWGCLLTIITGGLFIPLWILIVILEAFKPYRCQNCGRYNRPGSRSARRVVAVDPNAPPPLPAGPSLPHRVGQRLRDFQQANPQRFTLIVGCAAAALLAIAFVLIIAASA